MSETKEMGELIDASSGDSLSVGVPTKRVTSEVLTMMTGMDDDDVVFGRMPVGMDESDFDALPPREIDMDRDMNPDLFADEYELGQTDVMEQKYPVFAGEDDEVAPAFEAPSPTSFPVFQKALHKFQKADAKPKLARIDTDETYGSFVCEHAVKELSRRVNELRSALEEHLTEDHGKQSSLRKWDEILGAAQAVNDLRAATTTHEAVSALPAVPLDLPSFAEGKVKCWKDGNDIVCSLRFGAADGTVRVATMAARPQVDNEEISGWARRKGVSPVTLLGAAEDVADIVCGKKLVKDLAGAALRVRDRADVCGMTEPLLLANQGTAGSAPLAALMHVEQQADAGDPQAREEMDLICGVASTVEGRHLMPLLAASKAKLAAGRAKKVKAVRKKMSLLQKYALAAGWA